MVRSESRTHDLPRHSPVHNQVSNRCATKWAIGVRCTDSAVSYNDSIVSYNASFYFQQELKDTTKGISYRRWTKSTRGSYTTLERFLVLGFSDDRNQNDQSQQMRTIKWANHDTYWTHSTGAERGKKTRVEIILLPLIGWNGGSWFLTPPTDVFLLDTFIPPSSLLLFRFQGVQFVYQSMFTDLTKTQHICAIQRVSSGEEILISLW